MVGSEMKEYGLSTGLPFQDRQAGYTTQTPGEKGTSSARNGYRVNRSRRWMDILESPNGMLIKGLGCGLRCKEHLQLQSFPLGMSVISAQTRQLCWPPDAPCSTSATAWLVWTLQLSLGKNNPNSTSLQPYCYTVLESNGNRAK